MLTFYKKNSSKGFSLVEVVIATAIISIALFSLMSASTKGIQLSDRALKQTQANLLLEEGAEAVKSIRDDAWSNISALTVGTTYYLTYNTGTNTWSLGTTPTEAIDSIFTRTVVISSVNRDASDDITLSGGTLDARTKKVSINVSWLSTAISTPSISNSEEKTEGGDTPVVVVAPDADTPPDADGEGSAEAPVTITLSKDLSFYISDIFN